MFGGTLTLKETMEMSKERKKNKKSTAFESPFLSMSMKLSIINQETGRKDNSFST